MSTARVDFTRGAAERIARAVRIVEQGERNGTPLRFGKVESPAAFTGVRMVTFTGAWPKASTKVCTFVNSTRTVAAVNVFFGVGVGCTARYAAITLEQGTWFMVNAEC